MNRLPLAKRAQILSMLCEGSSMRSISRVADCSINTVAKLLVDAGEAAVDYHDAHVRGVAAKRVQCDEIWSFIGVKQKNVASSKRSADSTAGDVWTWTAIASDTKLIISYLVGGRDAEYALAVMDDLRSRVTTRMQLTTDGHGPYLRAVEEAFGADIDSGQIVKMYGAPPAEAEAARCYSPLECIGSHKTKVTGNPDPKHISTSYVERQNLTMRMAMRWFTRLTNAFSRKFENHCHMVALYALWYNFVRIQKTLRTTPAMAAGIDARLRSMEDVVALIDEQAERTAPNLADRLVG